jgi:hypothetical protein
VRDVAGPAATLSRVCSAIFVPFYVALDMLAGIGTGMLIQHAQTLPADQLAPAEKAVDVLWAGGITYALGAVGSIAWAIAMYCAAVAFTEKSRKLAIAALSLVAFVVVGWGVSNCTYGTGSWWITLVLIGVVGLALGRPRGPSALLILSAMLFGTLHVPPFGPLGMFCFLAAAIWLTVSAERTHRPVVSAATS